jgi:hypothetical protein
MRIHGLAIGLMMAVGGCGYGPDIPQAAGTKVTFVENSKALITAVDDSDLKTDSDVVVVGVYGWIDLMPGVGFAGGPHTRLQVKMKVPSRGCTTAGDFRATLTPLIDKQVLTITRTRTDVCTENSSPVDINLNVYGTYRPATPLVMNGVDLPVMERIIY